MGLGKGELTDTSTQHCTHTYMHTHTKTYSPSFTHTHTHTHTHSGRGGTPPTLSQPKLLTEATSSNPCKGCVRGRVRAVALVQVGLACRSAHLVCSYLFEAIPSGLQPGGGGVWCGRGCVEKTTCSYVSRDVRPGKRMQGMCVCLCVSVCESKSEGNDSYKWV